MLPEVLVSIVFSLNWPAGWHSSGEAIESFCEAICWQNAMKSLRHSTVCQTNLLLALDIELVEHVAAAACVHT
jgi:hypothetical protein